MQEVSPEAGRKELCSMAATEKPEALPLPSLKGTLLAVLWIGMIVGGVVLGRAAATVLTPGMFSNTCLAIVAMGPALLLVIGFTFVEFAEKRKNVEKMSGCLSGMATMLLVWLLEWAYVIEPRHETAGGLICMFGSIALAVSVAIDFISYHETACRIAVDKRPATAALFWCRAFLLPLVVAFGAAFWGWSQHI